ncbi:MAG: NADH:flavin oxidoreductase [Desulfobacterales bacterium]|nr:MAG: NADH:flavin oxidoreductase [Desulfobacterales bacterium]
MSKLFEQTTINGMTVSNRFVRSATWEGMATDDGACTPKLIDLMANLAKGGVGLIVSSHAYVQKEGQATPWQLGVDKDELIPGLKDMTDAVHENGGKIVMQLSHGGFFSYPKLTGQTPMAPSKVEGIAKSPRKEMTVDDIQHVIRAFEVGAKRAKDAGFDGVQIHSAHGYLPSQFLSPVFNQRNDKYGGDIQNRARLHVEVVKLIRQTVGKNYPVLIKMNCQDFIENGLDLQDSLQAAQMLANAGIDAIELSGGVLTGGKLNPSRMGIKSEDKEAYFQKEAKAFKSQIDVPLILVGGNRSYQVAERLVEQGVADYISMSRPFVREPDLIKRWKSGDLQKAACVSDNMCFKPAMKGDGIYCVTEEREKRK